MAHQTHLITVLFLSSIVHRKAAQLFCQFPDKVTNKTTQDKQCTVSTNSILAQLKLLIGLWKYPGYCRLPSEWKTCLIWMKLLSLSIIPAKYLISFCLAHFFPQPSCLLHLSLTMGPAKAKHLGLCFCFLSLGLFLGVRWIWHDLMSKHFCNPLATHKIYMKHKRVFNIYLCLIKSEKIIITITSEPYQHLQNCWCFSFMQNSLSFQLMSFKLHDYFVSQCLPVGGMDIFGTAE